ncbi:MAG TPA: hydrogenase maturation nickel metallochaperone HypA [Holophagaceae bacterium]|nr:hydrogenase maturation nickel metallochaperone HypA [Holophagaceae bacterium]
MAIIESMLQTVEEEVRSRRLSKVHGIVLEIGTLAGVELEALRFAFEAVAPGTLAEGASLEIEQLPGHAWCGECSKEVAVLTHFDRCPGCGRSLLVVQGGTDLRLKALDVD